jgi:Ca-activated chloride channel family protein
MTDGYVGNDMAIIDAVGKNAGTARVFSFGIGRSVNRFLLDGMARAGRGEVHYILNEEQARGAAERFYERVRMPVLTDVELDFGDLDVDEVYPARIPDLFSAKPVVVKGRYEKGGKATITLRGTTGEGPFERKIEVNLPGEAQENDVLASLWARAKVDHFMGQDLAGMQRGNPDPAVKEEILGLGLRYQLLTQFTSFVAVEHLRITEGDTVRTVPVPVEMPEGVSYEGVFGTARGTTVLSRRQSVNHFALMPSGPKKQLSGGGAGYGGLALGQVPGRPSASPAPMPATKAAEAKAERADAPEAAKLDPKQIVAMKLAQELQGLAERVAKEGADGNFTVGKIRVNGGRVEVQVFLTKLSEQVLAKLKELGFKELARAKSVNLLIGTIDVSKLEDLARIDEVRRVEPST